MFCSNQITLTGCHLDKHIKMLHNNKLQKIVWQFSRASVALFQALRCSTQKQAQRGIPYKYFTTPLAARARGTILLKHQAKVEILQKPNIHLVSQKTKVTIQLDVLFKTSYCCAFSGFQVSSYQCIAVM